MSETLIAFIAMTTLVSAVPGPSVIFVTTQGAWRGPVAGLSAVAGIQLGVFIYFLLTAFGLAQLIATSQTLFLIIKWVGVAYLFWIGAHAIWASFRKVDDHAEPVQMRAVKHGFRDGVVVSLSNPKGLLYFIALLPQFLDPTQTLWPQVLKLGVFAMAIDASIQSAYALTGAFLSKGMQKQGVNRWMERGVGSAFLLLSGFAALTKRAI